MSDDGGPGYLTGIHVIQAFAVQDVDIEIGEGSGGGPQHLILTGPNGSGKSSVLRGLFYELLTVPHGVGANYETYKHREPADMDLPVVSVRGHESLEAHLLVMLGTDRKLEAQPVEGPKTLDLVKEYRGVSQYFLQYLINRRTEQAYAREDGDQQAADAIAKWFDDLEANLREIFGDPQLVLVHDRHNFEYRIRFEGKREVGFKQLPDGFSSVLDIWAEILLQVERFRQVHSREPAGGFVLIDELELHLHAELQEKILPFLTRLFPTLQFIVTTHSPAIASSIDNATVFDLRTRERISSSELRGLRYGSIFTEWFGIATDFDLRTTAELERLKTLAQLRPASGSPEYEELTKLADRLADQSHLLAIEVRKRLEDARD